MKNEAAATMFEQNPKRMKGVVKSIAVLDFFRKNIAGSVIAAANSPRQLRLMEETAANLCVGNLAIFCPEFHHTPNDSGQACQRPVGRCQWKGYRTLGQQIVREVFFNKT
jgi:hypothetical protein